MKTDYDIRRGVMRRVWSVYVVRKLTSPLVRLVGFAVVILALPSFVSFEHVLENTLSVSAGGVGSLFNFFIDAVTTTESAVLALGVIAVFLIGWFVMDSVENFRYAALTKSLG